MTARRAAAEPLDLAVAREGTTDPDDLIERAFQIIASRITKAGHLAQLVTQEHWGNCSHRSCTPGCEEADRWLERQARRSDAARGEEARTG